MDENSVASYHKCIEEGLFSKRKKQILLTMLTNRPGTARSYSRLIPGAWKHFARLRRMGLVSTAGKTFDTVTLRSVWLWDLSKEFADRIKAPLPGKASGVISRAKVIDILQALKSIELERTDADVRLDEAINQIRGDE